MPKNAIGCAERRKARERRQTRTLAQTKRVHQKLVAPIIAGVPTEQVKHPMIELDQQRQRLERKLSASLTPEPIQIHPSMAVTYPEIATDMVSSKLVGIAPIF